MTPRPTTAPKSLAALAESDLRVSLLRHEVNQGHIATYNEGLWAIDGEYAVLLSADDVLPSGSLTRATALLEANPTVGLVYGFPMRFGESPPERAVTIEGLVRVGRPGLARADVPAGPQLHLQPRGGDADRRAATDRRLPE